MLKLTVGLLAVALAGTASAVGWRDLRVDASSEAAFAQSLTVFKDKLSPARRYVFAEALKDIWVQGTLAAEAESREYTVNDYHRHIDGLRYEEIVEFTDPTGKTARERHTLACLNKHRFVSGPSPNWGARPEGGWGTNPASIAQQAQQGMQRQ